MSIESAALGIAEPAETATWNPRDYVISARHLSKSYTGAAGEVHALRDISIDIPRGRFTSVMGLSGSGKSTLVHVLSGLDLATSGTVWVDGLQITGMRDRELSKLRAERIGFVFQSFNLLPSLSVRRNIELPMDLWGEKPQREWVEYMVSLVGLQDKLNQPAATLSGGERQRVAIARALASQPSVIVADEPTGNLDVVNRQTVLDLFRYLTDAGHTILMVTHDPEAASYSDRLLLLEAGRVVASQAAPSEQEIRDLLMAGV